MNNLLANPTQGEAWIKVQKFMYGNCGVVLDSDQVYLMESRLGPLARRFKFPSTSEFVTAACAQPATKELTDCLIDAMTTHETYFFRDAPFWKALEERLLPAFIKKHRSGSGLRIWSTGCSTGQEPYSLLMLMNELCPSILNEITLIASDVSEPTMAQAQEGIFNQYEVSRGLSQERLMRHLDPLPNNRWQVKAHLRSVITYEKHNLTGADVPPMNCSLVMCRNVLIYFSDEDRDRAIRKLFRATAPDGLVCVGGTEILKGQQVAPSCYSALGPTT